MKRAKSCQNCKNFLKNDDYYFDSDLNVICNHCKCFVFKHKETKSFPQDALYKFNVNKLSKL